MGFSTSLKNNKTGYLGAIMIKNLLTLFTLILISAPVMAQEDSLEAQIIKEQNIQTRVSDIGAKLLNANKIEQKVIFLYNTEQKESLLNSAQTVTSREVVLYDGYYKFTQNDDELAAYIARGILIAMKSYHGFFNGYLSALQIKAAPKKFEIVADKRAVDFMVNAGYNPLGLITFIQKSCPQKRFDKISTKNLASKRLAIIYEYIYTKYPYFLANNTYLDNEHYQNFLLTSQHNRLLLQEKIKTGSKENLKYE